MKLNAGKLALATVATTAILWILRSLLMMMMPGGMFGMMGAGNYPMNNEMVNSQWGMGGHGMFMGLIGWVIFSGVAAWLIATIYNRLIGSDRV